MSKMIPFHPGKTMLLLLPVGDAEYLSPPPLFPRAAF